MKILFNLSLKNSVIVFFINYSYLNNIDFHFIDVETISTKPKITL